MSISDCGFVAIPDAASGSAVAQSPWTWYHGGSNPEEALMIRSYTVVIERDPESGWLVGEVVGLPGCYTQAPDLPALEANMREAISAYLHSAETDEPASHFVGTLQMEVAA